MSDRDVLKALLADHECEAGGWHCSCQPVDAEQRREVLPTTWEAHLADAILAAGWRLPAQPRCRRGRPLAEHARPCEPGCEYPGD